MKEEEIINIITIVICAIALVPSLILITYQILKKRKGIDAAINYILCFCCMIESRCRGDNMQVKRSVDNNCGYYENVNRINKTFVTENRNTIYLLIYSFIEFI